MFGVVRSERTIKGKTSQEERLYIFGSIPVQASALHTRCAPTGG